MTLPQCPKERREFKQTQAYKDQIIENQKEATRKAVRAFNARNKARADADRNKALESVLSDYRGQYKQLGNYYIFDNGKVWSWMFKRFCKEHKTNDGYIYIGMAIEKRKTERFLVHRLVAQAFIGEIPDGYEVDHINFVRDDNNLSNLQIVPIKENRQKHPKSQIVKQ